MAATNPTEQLCRTAEKRKAPRKKTLLRGKLVHAEGAYSLDCTIRDVSASGVRISIPRGVMVPNRVFLIDMRTATAHECDVKWRLTSEIGLHVIRSAVLDGPVPAELAFLKGIWIASFAGFNPDGKRLGPTEEAERRQASDTAALAAAAAEAAITPEMIGAGIAAYAAWKPEQFAWIHSENDMVCAIFRAMRRAARPARNKPAGP